MKKHWSTHCLFCEDVRQEVGNKLSLMGLLPGGDLNVLAPEPTPESPAALPKIVVIVYIVTDVDDIPASIKLRILSPYKREEVAQIEAGTPPIQHAEGATKAVFTSLIELQPLVLRSAGYLEVMLELDGEETRAGRLKIDFVTPPAS